MPVIVAFEQATGRAPLPRPTASPPPARAAATADWVHRRRGAAAPSARRRAVGRPQWGRRLSRWAGRFTTGGQTMAGSVTPSHASARAARPPSRTTYMRQTSALSDTADSLLDAGCGSMPAI
jgi:hypothetical protein